MNRVILMGRITHDLELRQTQTGNASLSFQIAVDRYMGQGKDKGTDFIHCTAFGNNAENIHRFFGKGRLILIEGSLRADGSKYTDRSGVERQSMPSVWIDRFDFTGDRPNNNNNGGYNNYGGNAGYNNGGYNNNGYNGNAGYNNGGYNGGYNNAPNNYNNQPAPQQNNQSNLDIPPVGDVDDFSEVFNAADGVLGEGNDLPF